MLFKIEEEYFDGAVKVISSPVFSDERGIFSITYLEDEMRQLGLPPFVRDNFSRSAKNVIRGLHYQIFPPMGKLIRVTRGAAFIVAVDIRVSSPTFGQWHEMILSEKDNLQIWASEEFARGFCALEDNVDVQYKCSAHFNRIEDKVIRWDSFGIKWPIAKPILSERDRFAMTVDELYRH
jgi:dTDP-4-dehydrorhamnose 3,5-epimerase